MKPPSVDYVQKYLSAFSAAGNRIKIEYFGPLNLYGIEKGGESKGRDIKKLGYGQPYLIVYSESRDGRKPQKNKKAILSTMRIGYGFGHDYRSDRIDNQVLAFDTWNMLPKHCKVWDIGAFNKRDSSLISLGSSGEFFLLRPMIPGTEYYKDLDRIFEGGKIEDSDLRRAESLARYLARIHSKKYKGDGRRELYERKIRDTVGHGECIFGLVDSYPPKPGRYLREGELEEIEKKCITERWKIKEKNERLCQVHGDFHPWNILFKENSGKHPSADFVVLDRSRGEWGEPADDVCALSINYLFYGIRRDGEMRKDFLELFSRFMQTYQEETNDPDSPEIMPLFYVFRALVIASPVWYPALTDDIRRKIFNFAENLLDEGSFDYERVMDYFKESR